MKSHRLSIWKTILAVSGMSAVFSGLVILALFYFSPPLKQIFIVIVSVLQIMALGLLIGGFLCLYRDKRQWSGKQDVYYAYLQKPHGLERPGLRPFYRFLRPLFGSALRHGDLVRVLPAAQIQQTLDKNGMLENLPFMPEMLTFCDQTFRVHQRVDKINDMMTKTGLRRFKNTVTLQALRCNGAAHNSCDAECQLLWKEAWLQRLKDSPRETINTSNSTASENVLPDLVNLLNSNTTQAYHDANSADGEGPRRYQCQITELLKASYPMSPWDIRQDLRSLLWGNVGLIPFLVALFTRFFNEFQSLRGGIGYPWRPTGECTKTPRENLDLQPGEYVRVKNGREIAKTLDRKNRNRGMWFDREMLRFSGQELKVHKRVEKLIDERNGEMVEMKTPCVSLEGDTATGEFLRFNPQNEYSFWREVWLERTQSKNKSNARHES